MEHIKTAREFYKILTEEGAQEATIMLYGFIGEEYELDEETGRWTKAGITDIEFVKELSRLADQYPVIHLRINSPGGSTFHGPAIMTAIQACKSEVHTWNDGVAASMAADIWLCGQRRHMAKNALLMIHSAWDFCMGHAQDMRDCAEFLDKTNGAIITAVAACTGKTEDEIRSAYYADYKDHWLNYNDALADGLITETGDQYDAADPAAGIEKMTYKQLLTHFEQRNHPDAPGLMKKLKDAFASLIGRRGGHKSTTISQLNTTDMNLEDFKKSLTDGTLDKAAAKQVLDAMETPADPEANAELTALNDDLAAQKAMIENLTQKLAELGAQPGAGKTIPAIPDADTSAPQVVTGGKPDALKALVDASMEVAEQNGTLRFTTATKGN